MYKASVECPPHKSSGSIVHPENVLGHSLNVYGMLLSFKRMFDNFSKRKFRIYDHCNHFILYPEKNR